MTIRVLPGGDWPRALSGQSPSSDLLNRQKPMVSYWFHHQSPPTPINTSALASCHASVFAARRKPGVSCVSIRYAMSMLDSIFMFAGEHFCCTSVSRQRCCTFMWHALSMFRNCILVLFACFLTGALAAQAQVQSDVGISVRSAL